MEEVCGAFNDTSASVSKSLLIDELLSPEVPLEAEQQMIIDLEDEVGGLERTVPWWCRHVCINRDLWRMTAVCADPNPEVAWLVLLAIQPPQKVVFLELRRRERTFDPDVAYTRSDG